MDTSVIRVETVLVVEPRKNEVFVSFDSDESARAFELWVRCGKCWDAFNEWLATAPPVFRTRSQHD